MFEILPNPSIETVMLVGRAALLLGAFWIFALAFRPHASPNERHMQHLAAQLQRTFAEVRSLHETIAVMCSRMDAMSERAESDARLAPAARSARSSAVMTWQRAWRRTGQRSMSWSRTAVSRDTRRSCSAGCT
jgi:hypothetical protein